MPVPNFQTFMLPVLEFFASGSEASIATVMEPVAAAMGLTDDDRAESTSTGEPRYRNRVRWSIKYLSEAGLLEKPERGLYRITPRGREALASGVARIDNEYLAEFEEFRAFKSRSSASDTDQRRMVHTAGLPDETPEESLEASYRVLRSQVAHDLLDRLRASDPVFFERIVLELLVAMGYGGSFREAASTTRRCGDEGIDGIIKEDRLGLDVVCVQAKRWSGARTVGEPELRDFVGGLDGQRASKGVFITTARFSDGAKRYARNTTKRVVLIDGDDLAEMMIDFGIGVSRVASYLVHRVDEDYFLEG